MSYLYIVAIIALFYGLMQFFTEMTHRQKLQVSAVVLLVVVSAVAYNRMTDKEQVHVRGMILKFNQHETLDCGGIEVNDANFTLSVGTQSFIANEGTPYAGRIINAAGCR